MQPPKMPRKQLERFAAIAKKTGYSVERVIEEWQERAAIREFCGGLSRAEAEFHAYADVDEMLPTQRPMSESRIARGAPGARYVPDGEEFW